MSVQKFIQMKGRQKIAMLTAYDCLTAKLLADAGIDLILVGDSLGQTFQGKESTVPVTLEEMIYHVKAVRKGAPGAFVIADMPFLSYGVSVNESVRNAGRIMKESGANAVKLEGGKEMADTVRAMVSIGIPVMGHIGLKPQSVNQDGLKISGKTRDDTEELLEDARALEKAGAFSFVLEGTTDEAACEIVKAVSIPVIGIGAGKNTDGQVLVVTDMLGMDSSAEFKHNRKFADLAGTMKKAFQAYIEEVKKGTFPSEDQTFHRPK